MIALLRRWVPRSALLALAALLPAGCGPDAYTCEDEVPTTVTVSPKAPIEVDKSQPDNPPAAELEAVFQASVCNGPSDSLEIASAKVVDFNSGEKLLDLTLRFSGGAEDVPACLAVGASSIFKVEAEGLTNGDLAPLCGRKNLALETLVKRAGCADTSPATRTSKTLIDVVCP